MYSMHIYNVQRNSMKSIIVLFSYVAFVILTIFVISVSLSLSCGLKLLLEVTSLAQYLLSITTFVLLLADIFLHDTGSKKITYIWFYAIAFKIN